ncbi:paired amphipathic helix protein Sin3a [Beauveria brongniartii RCEF 3172]|uniref:Paired amphipathic helix protein Sin3a n=1 Tax=Beauveria brongniartii RCEF 3172 TaxID=1081107 RepID=A0A167GJY4_9HYPO|nr:paired amphipathic helix protein Sin3a [Beauveria brongniartii RCEF 3172]
MLNPTSRVKSASRVGLVLLLCLPFLGVAEEEPALAKFGDVIQVFGQMTRTDQDFTDGLALDLFSPKNRTLVVTSNTSPLSGSFVQGSTGEGWVNLSNYSWIIKFNESARDLIAKIELPYDPVAVAKEGVDPANTYVGTLAADKKSWIVSETQRNVHVTENKTRIIKMTSLDGEYMLLGRRSADTANIFVQYGQGATRTVNVTAGAGDVQEAEFVDGLRFRIQSAKAFVLNADIPFRVDAKAIPEPYKALNSFAWKINSTAPSSEVSVNMTFPVNEDILRQRASPEAAESARLLVAWREVEANATARFEPLKTQHFDRYAKVIHARVAGRPDGQYVVLVAAAEASRGKNCNAPAKGGKAATEASVAEREECENEESSPASGAAKEGSGEEKGVPVVSSATSLPSCLAAAQLLLLGLLVL